MQDELEVRKDVVGLLPNTEYRFRLVLMRVFEDRLYETIDISAVTIAKTECAGGLPF